MISQQMLQLARAKHARKQAEAKRLADSLDCPISEAMMILFKMNRPIKPQFKLGLRIS